jgi:hypothetical protein
VGLEEVDGETGDGGGGGKAGTVVEAVEHVGLEGKSGQLCWKQEEGSTTYKAAPQLRRHVSIQTPHPLHILLDLLPFPEPLDLRIPLLRPLSPVSSRPAFEFPRAFVGEHKALAEGGEGFEGRGRDDLKDVGLAARADALFEEGKTVL